MHVDVHVQICLDQLDILNPAVLLARHILGDWVFPQGLHTMTRILVIITETLCGNPGKRW